MEDKDIIHLYWKRIERAITETDQKYGRLCRTISRGIVPDQRDSEEVVNDTWMALWETIPPERPNMFKAYICRIVKNLSLKRFSYNHAAKRTTELECSLEELKDCLCMSTDKEGRDASENTVLDEMVRKELIAAINDYLGNLSHNNRVLFLERYWFLYSVKEIAHRHKMTEKNASARLGRIRTQLKKHLQEEGYEI